MTLRAKLLAAGVLLSAAASAFILLRPGPVAPGTVPSDKTAAPAGRTPAGPSALSAAAPTGKFGGRGGASRKPPRLLTFCVPQSVSDEKLKQMAAVHGGRSFGRLDYRPIVALVEPTGSPEALLKGMLSEPGVQRAREVWTTPMTRQVGSQWVCGDDDPRAKPWP